MRKTTPSKQELVAFLEDIIKKYPPTLLSYVTTGKDSSVMAYQELIGEYSGLLFDYLFFRIYQPHKTAAQIADEILSPEIVYAKKKRERSRERGRSRSNKILLEADRIIFRPAKLIETQQCAISKNKFHSLLIIAHRLREKGHSIDHFFAEHHYADDIRKLIAHCLCVIYEANMMFRNELYRAYGDKAKTIKKMPETDEYYRDAQKLKGAMRGKQVTKNAIEKDAKEYREYLMSGPSDGYYDRRFYDVKGFRFLTWLIIKINNFFRKDVQEPKKAKSSPHGSSNATFRFSIDNYIDAAMKKPKPIYGVGIMALPAIKISMKGHVTQTR